MTVGSLLQAINLQEPGSSSPCSSGQHSCRQQRAGLQSHPCWLRNQGPPPLLAQRNPRPRKTPLPQPAPRPGVGTGWATGSGGSLCNLEGAAQQQQQPAIPKSLGCSKEQSTRAAAVLGGNASATTSPAWICTVYLHKRAGSSILPLIRGCLCLARSPHTAGCPQPLSLLLSAGL